MEILFSIVLLVCSVSCFYDAFLIHKGKRELSKFESFAVTSALGFMFFFGWITYGL